MELACSPHLSITRIREGVSVELPENAIASYGMLLHCLLEYATKELGISRKYKIEPFQLHTHLERCTNCR